MACALKPGFRKVEHNEELVFLLDGKRARHGSKLFLQPTSCITSMPEIENDCSYVLEPRKAIDGNRSSCLYVEKDENVQVLLERWGKESIWNFEGSFLLGYHKESPGLIFCSEYRARDFFADSFFQKKHSILLESLILNTPTNILFLPLDALISVRWLENPFEELKVSEVTAYGIPNDKVKGSRIKSPSNSQTKSSQESIRNKKLELVALANKLNECKEQLVLNKDEHLVDYISKRLSFLKFLRAHFRWEAEAIFWNFPVWWHCEIAYHRSESAKKLNSLKYGIDYFFDIFHLAEVILLNPDFASNKNAIDNETLESIAEKYSSSNFHTLGDTMDLPSRIFQLATYFQYRVFDEYYFQEMLIDEGWDVFETVSADSKKRKSLNQNLFFIPPEFKSRLKISQDNFIRFVADRDYFTNRRQVVDYVLKNYSNHRKFISLNGTTMMPSNESFSKQHQQQQQKEQVQYVGTSDDNNVDIVNSPEGEISLTHPAPPRLSSLDSLVESRKERPLMLQNTSTVTFAPAVLNRSSALSAAEVDSFQMMVTEARKQQANKNTNAVSKSTNTVAENSTNNKVASEDDSDVEFIDDNNYDLPPTESSGLSDSGNKPMSSSVPSNTSINNSNISCAPVNSDSKSGHSRLEIQPQNPVIAAKLAYFARLPGVTIVDKHENEDPQRPVILHVVHYELPKLTQIPLPVGCDPNYVLKLPIKSINSGEVHVSSSSMHQRDDSQQTVSANTQVGIKRPASNRSSSTKRSRLSEDDFTQLPASEELNGYTIFS